MRNRLHAREADLLVRRTCVSLGHWCLWLLTGLCLLSRLTAGEPIKGNDLPSGLYAEIETPRGTMMAELFFERAPLTVANFVGLAEGTLGPKPGVPYYDGLVFHRVVPGFVVQGGDPVGTGEGGPGYSLPDEFDPGLRHDAVGTLSMANEGPDTNGSQFFITLAPTARLDFLHSVFGKLVQGSDVVSRIQQGDWMRVTIHREGEAARRFRSDRASVEALAAKLPRASTSTEAPHFFEDPDNLLPTTPPRAKYFGYKLANIARATDVRIFARVYAALPPALGKDTAEALKQLSSQLGFEQRGVLAVYWADHDTWDIVVGRDDVARFCAQSATVGPLEQRVREILTAAERRSVAWVKEAEKDKRGISPAQSVKLKVDGVLQEIIAAMEPKQKESLFP